MLRKGLYLLLAVSILYALGEMGKRKKRTGGSLLRSIGKTLGLLAWALLAVYLAVFIYWVYTQVR
jgi:hypothetical protein